MTRVPTTALAVMTILQIHTGQTVPNLDAIAVRDTLQRFLDAGLIVIADGGTEFKTTDLGDDYVRRLKGVRPVRQTEPPVRIPSDPNESFYQIVDHDSRYVIPVRKATLDAATALAQRRILTGASESLYILKAIERISPTPKQPPFTSVVLKDAMAAELGDRPAQMRLDHIFGVRS
jgi:hypothetical protein